MIGKVLRKMGRSVVKSLSIFKQVGFLGSVDIVSIRSLTWFVFALIVFPSQDFGGLLDCFIFDRSDRIVTLLWIKGR